VEKENHISFIQNLSFRIIEDPTEVENSIQQSLTLLFVNITKPKAGLSNSNKENEENTNGG
jgi:hypothetical protein